MQGERGRLPPIRDCGRDCVCVGASVGGLAATEPVTTPQRARSYGVPLLQCVG